MSPRLKIGTVVTDGSGVVQGRIASYDKAPVAPYKKEWSIVDWDGWGLTLTDPDTIKAVKSRDALAKVIVTATTEPLEKETIMNKVIKTPATVQELFQTARAIDMAPSKLIALFDEVLGNDWPEGEPQEITLHDTDAEAWDPHLNEWQRPANVPPGFHPYDASWKSFVGKKVKGPRWRIESEWSPEDGFSLTFWTTDDDAMTATETNEYIGALMNMTAYVTKMEHGITTDVEA